MTDSDEGGLDAAIYVKVLGEVLYQYMGLLYKKRCPNFPFF